jgi:argininosuccinate lyase
MPQKRNPDALELIRGRWHEATGYAHTIRSLSAGLISGYHRDLQLVKKASFALNDLSASVMDALDRCLAGVRFERERCEGSITPDVMATHHANRLVRNGLPFRQAYRQTAADLAAGKVGVDSDPLEAYSNSGEPGHPVFVSTSANEAWIGAQFARIEQAKTNSFGTFHAS